MQQKGQFWLALLGGISLVSCGLVEMASPGATVSSSRQPSTGPDGGEDLPLVELYLPKQLAAQSGRLPGGTADLKPWETLPQPYFLLGYDRGTVAALVETLYSPLRERGLPQPDPARGLCIDIKARRAEGSGTDVEPSAVWLGYMGDRPRLYQIKRIGTSERDYSIEEFDELGDADGRTQCTAFVSDLRRGIAANAPNVRDSETNVRDVVTNVRDVVTIGLAVTVPPFALVQALYELFQTVSVVVREEAKDDEVELWLPRVLGEMWRGPHPQQDTADLKPWETLRLPYILEAEAPGAVELVEVLADVLREEGLPEPTAGQGMCVDIKLTPEGAAAAPLPEISGVWLAYMGGRPRLYEIERVGADGYAIHERSALKIASGATECVSFVDRLVRRSANRKAVGDGDIRVVETQLAPSRLFSVLVGLVDAVLVSSWSQ